MRKPLTFLSNENPEPGAKPASSCVRSLTAHISVTYNNVDKVEINGVPISHDHAFDSLHPVPLSFVCALHPDRNRLREEGAETQSSMQLQEIVTHLPHFPPSATSFSLSQCLFLHFFSFFALISPSCFAVFEPLLLLLNNGTYANNVGQVV